MSEIRIEGGKTKVLDSTWENDQIVLIIILSILRFKIEKQTKSLDIRLLCYLLDSIKKHTSPSKSSVLLSAPWHFDNQFRNRILIGSELGLISVTEKDSKIKLCLTDLGVEQIDSILSQGLMKGLLDRVRIHCRMVNKKELGKQHLSW